MLNQQVHILAIETSADETSAAVLSGDTRTETCKLKSNIIHSQIKIHRKTGGIVPEVAARAHIPKIIPAIKTTLGKAKIRLSQIDCLAVTAGPGLITSLRIGVDTAKTLAFALRKPLIPINHLEGHLLSALPTSHQLPATKLFPAVGLVVSGGHTLLILVKGFGKYRILGETVDDAAGEAFDKIAKILGLPYPGGPQIANLAEGGNPGTFPLPRPMLNQKNFNFSFAGLKTAVLYALRDLPQAKIKPARADIAASVEQSIVEVLVKKTVRAAKEFAVKTVLLGGGVAANTKLQKSLKTQISKEIPNTQYFIPLVSLTGDNAGMIAIAAFYHYRHKKLSAYQKIQANPNWPLKSWR